MRAARVPVIVVLVWVAAALVAAQGPSFAGKWTLVPDPSGSVSGFGGLGQSATISQDQTSMTIVRSTQMGEFTSTYKLDGSESKNTLTFQGNTIDQLSTAKWSGDRLTVDTSMSFDGNPVQVSMTMWLDPSGSLIVESTRPDFQGGGSPITTRFTYKKS